MHKEDIVLKFVNTNKQLISIFTKPLNEDKFGTIRREIGMTGSAFP